MIQLVMRAWGCELYVLRWWLSTYIYIYIYIYGRTLANGVGWRRSAAYEGGGVRESLRRKTQCRNGELLTLMST